jgi:O-antigen/teichoic acid export membrane protein
MWTGALYAANALLNLGLALALAWVLPASTYGAFTLYFATSLLISHVSFDWIRSSAMRFYTPLARAQVPELRATLDVAMAYSTGVTVTLAIAFVALGFMPEASPLALFALIIVTLSNAGFEYWTALCRARFDARRYAVMVGLRNVLTFGFAVPVALFTHSFALSLIAFAVAIVPSVLYGARQLADKEAKPRLATRALAWRFVDYALPLVIAEGCFSIIVVANRGFLAHSVSLAEAGAYALTFDLALRVLSVMASVGDAVLFPRLVADLHVKGTARTREEISRNIAVMLLVLTPAALGFALIAEPAAQLVLAEHFRDAFTRYAPAAIGAAFAYTVQTFVLRPAFQVELRTADMPLAAVVALLADIALLLVLPGGLFAAFLAHLGGTCLGLVLVLRRAIMARLIDWPLSDLGKIAISALALVLAILPLRFETHALLTLVARAVVGGGVYCAIVWYFDVAGLRAFFRPRRSSPQEPRQNGAGEASPI